MCQRLCTLDAIRQFMIGYLIKKRLETKEQVNIFQCILQNTLIPRQIDPNNLSCSES